MSQRGGWWLALLGGLLFFVTTAGSAPGDPAAVRRHAHDIVAAARGMVEQGGEGQLPVLTEHGQRVIALGKAALDAVPRPGNQHARDTIELLTAAMDHAQRAIADGEHGRWQEAARHAKETLRSARRGLSHAEAL